MYVCECVCFPANKRRPVVSQNHLKLYIESWPQNSARARRLVSLALAQHLHLWCLLYQYFPFVPLLYSVLDAEPITGIPTSRLTHTNNLDNLPTLQTQIPCHGILLQDTRQLRLLEAVPSEQGRLFVAREQHVAGYELVVGNVDEQVVLEEALNLGEVLDGRERFAGRGGEGDVRDHDARLVVVGDGVLCELANLGHAKLLVGQELDPDGTAVGDGVGVGVGRGRRVLAEHRLGRAGRELQLSTAVKGGVRDALATRNLLPTAVMPPRRKGLVT